MTPTEWEALKHQEAQVQDDIRIHYVDVGPRDATPLVLVHGWPDLGFAWRFQLPELMKKYRVIVPDMRGFGRSSSPKEISKYGGKNVTGDLARLLDILKIEKAVFIGHDWGGSTVWRMCLYHPQRVLAVAAVCTPYSPPAKEFVDLEAHTQRLPMFTYMNVLAQTKSTGKMLDEHAERFFKALFRHHREFLDEPIKDTIVNVPTSKDPIYTQLSSLLSQEELDFYVREYARHGFESTVNWYATRPIDFETERGMDIIIPHTALYIGARDDKVLKPELAVRMPQVIPNLEMTTIEDAGHWILWEQREQVTQKLVEWLAKVTTAQAP